MELRFSVCSSIWGYTLFVFYVCKIVIERSKNLGKRPNLNALDELFEKGIDFHLTDGEYAAITGASLPEGTRYLKRDSALAKKAAKMGYIVAEVQEKPIIARIVYLKKKEK